MTDEVVIPTPIPLPAITEIARWHSGSGSLLRGGVVKTITEKPAIELSLPWDYLEYTNVGGSSGVLDTQNAVLWTLLAGPDLAAIQEYLAANV